VLALHESGDLALVGGRDATAGVFSLSQNRLLQPLKGGQGSITSGVWAQDKAIIATSTGVVKVFEAEKEVSSFSAHGGRVNAVALHASSNKSRLTQVCRLHPRDWVFANMIQP